MNSKNLKRLIVLVAVLAVLAAIALVIRNRSAEQPQPSDSGLSSFYNQKVEWKQCGNEATQSCAQVKVPLDYTDLAKGDIAIAVSRTSQANKKAGDHLGAIFTNPGGPGAAGVEYQPHMVEMLGPEVLAKYDVVSFDPRGVGGSAQVKCLNTEQMDRFMADLGIPNNVTSTEQVAQSAASMGQGCEKESARIVPYISTNNAARDMDVIRAVLGEQKLNYFGASYGSNLGQVYATLFADKVGRFVLDGVVPMWLNLEQTGLGQAKGFDTTFQRFVANCPKHEECPLPTDPAEATAKVKELLDGLGSKNLPAEGDSSGREVTQAIAYNGILSAMYDDTYGWTELREALGQAFEGDGGGLLDLSDNYADRDDSGSVIGSDPEYGGILQSYYAISCLDQAGRADAEATDKLGQEWAKEAPMFGNYMAWTGLPCGSWPAPVDLAPDRDNWPNLPAMLLINYSEDPATPYQWAEEVAEALPKSALIKVPGPNHVAAFNDIKCVDDYVQDFYLEGKLPASRATCALN